jgi:hypothetical protein
LDRNARKKKRAVKPGGSAYSAVIRGLDPRIHRPRWQTISSNSLFEEGWIAGSSPAMTNVLSRCGTFEAAGYCLFDSSGEAVMTKFGTIGAACLAIALAASTPVLAQGRHGGGGFHGGGGHGGFGPGIAAGLVAGAVIGGAGYYGSGYSPGYYDDSYAYDNSDNSYAYGNGYNGAYDNGYAARNGFVCQPGTWFRGEDGRRHLCQ